MRNAGRSTGDPHHRRRAGAERPAGDHRLGGADEGAGAPRRAGEFAGGGDRPGRGATATSGSRRSRSTRCTRDSSTRSRPRLSHMRASGVSRAPGRSSSRMRIRTGVDLGSIDRGGRAGGLRAAADAADPRHRGRRGPAGADRRRSTTRRARREFRPSCTSARGRATTRRRACPSMSCRDAFGGWVRDFFARTLT